MERVKWEKRKYEPGTVGHNQAKRGYFTYDLLDPHGTLIGFVVDSGHGFGTSKWLGDRWADCGTHVDLATAKRAVEAWI